MSARRAQTGAEAAHLELELDAGPISYLNSGCEGAPLVLLHGLLMDAGLWDEVTAERAGAIIHIRRESDRNCPV